MLDRFYNVRTNIQEFIIVLMLLPNTTYLTATKIMQRYYNYYHGVLPLLQSYSLSRSIIR